MEKYIYQRIKNCRTFQLIDRVTSVLNLIHYIASLGGSKKEERQKKNLNSDHMT